MPILSMAQPAASPHLVPLLSLSLRFWLGCLYAPARSRIDRLMWLYCIVCCSISVNVSSVALVAWWFVITCIPKQMAMRSRCMLKKMSSWNTVTVVQYFVLKAVFCLQDCLPYQQPRDNSVLPKLLPYLPQAIRQRLLPRPVFYLFLLQNSRNGSQFMIIW